MTATLTERSEGTAAHKGFNPMRELENWRINQQARSPMEYRLRPGPWLAERNESKRASSGGARPPDTNIIICDAPAVVARENRERHRRTPAVHQGRTGEPGDSPAPRGDSGSHRAALRREHVRRVLRGPRHAAAGLQPRSRKRQSLPPDRGDDARSRGRLRAGEARSGLRVRRHELAARGGARPLEDGPTAGTRRSRSPVLHWLDALGGQSG